MVMGEVVEVEGAPYSRHRDPNAGEEDQPWELLGSRGCRQRLVGVTEGHDA